MFFNCFRLLNLAPNVSQPLSQISSKNTCFSSQTKSDPVTIKGEN